MEYYEREIIAVGEDGRETVYPSILYACAALGVSRQAIAQSMRKGCRSAGYRWRYGEYHWMPVFRRDEFQTSEIREAVPSAPDVSLDDIVSICGARGEEVRRMLAGSSQPYQFFARWYIRQRGLAVKSDDIARIAGYPSQSAKDCEDGHGTCQTT